MNALQGSLGVGVLANLLQYLALNGSSGRLTLRHARGSSGELFFEEGRLVHVRAEPFADVAALTLLLSWEEGHFGFRDGVSAPQRSLRVPLDTLLLEASRQADHARRSSGGDVSIDSVLAPSPLAERRSTVAMPLKALHLLRHLDGRRTLREIAVRTGATFDAVVGAAVELRRQRLVEHAVAPTVPEAYLHDLVQRVVERLGPVGEVVVEDALFDLGLDPAALPAEALPDLIEEVASQLRREDWRLGFRREADALRAEHGLARADGGGDA